VIRQASPADLHRLVAAADEVFRSPPKPGLGSMGHDYPLLFAPENAANLYLAERGDRGGDAAAPLAADSGADHGRAIIGHTGFTLRQAMVGGREVKVACLGAVFTLPAYRNQGLATRLLGAAVAGARAAGADLGLVSGARGLYASAGFAPYPAVRRYRLWRSDGAGNGHGARPQLRVEPYLPEALSDLAGMQEREMVHFVRPLDDWRRLLGAKVVFFEPGAVFTVTELGKRLAYLAVGRPVDDDGIGQGARVLEVGGDRQAIAAAGPALLDALDVEVLDVLMPAHDDSLETLAHQLGWTRDDVELPFSAAWWNPACAGLPLPFYGLNYV
jgi:predicted N-acetyltransferase YhbS